MDATAFNLREAAVAKWASIPAPMRLRIAYYDMLSSTYNSLGFAIAKVLQRAGVIVPVGASGRIDRNHRDLKNFGNIVFNCVVRVVKRADVAEDIIQEMLTGFLGRKFNTLKSALEGKEFDEARSYVLTAAINAAKSYGISESRKLRREVRLDQDSKDEKDHLSDRQMKEVVEKALEHAQNQGVKREDWWKHPIWMKVIDDIYSEIVKIDQQETPKTKSGIEISYLKFWPVHRQFSFDKLRSGNSLQFLEGSKEQLP